MVSSISTAQSGTGGLWMQIQQQLAQRNVEQAERQASALQGKAQDAQAIAERARENARSLKVEANQAQGEASQARQGLVASRALGNAQSQLSALHDQIVQLVHPVASQDIGSSIAVINALGQSTGSVVNVTA